jgi:hypothetical protein
MQTGSRPLASVVIMVVAWVFGWLGGRTPHATVFELRR